MTSKRRIKTAIKDNLLIWVGVIAASFLIIVAGYFLPNGRIRRNLSDAPGIMIAEGEHPDKYTYDPGSELDNFTDAIILNVASDFNSDRNPFAKAATNSFYYSDNPEISQSQYLKDALEKPIETNSDYTRYWFGSSTAIRFLATLLNFKEIRFVIAFIVVLLFVLAIAEVYHKLGTGYAIALAISMLLTRIFSVSVAIQYAPVYIITLAAVFGICKLSNTKKYHMWLPTVFMTAGTLTVIFDLLTFPLMTLGIPLTIALIIELKNSKKNDYKKIIKNSFIYCAIWGISYAFTNLAKWIFASIILGRNEITPAIKQFFFRANSGEEKIAVGDMFEANFVQYFSKIVLICLAVYLIIWIIVAIRKKIHPRKMLPMLLFAILAVFPYIWYAVLSNHSYIHYWMTYRIQAITMFSLLAGSLYCLDFNKEKK